MISFMVSLVGPEYYYARVNMYRHVQKHLCEQTGDVSHLPRPPEMFSALVLQFLIASQH